MLGETVKKKFLFWAVVSVIGAICLSFPDISSLKDVKMSIQSLFKGDSLKGLMFSCLAILFWGASTVIGKLFSPQAIKR